MPLSTVCVSTVSSRPRAWSSYSNIRSKDAQGLVTMNSAEEISKYKAPSDNYYSPTLQRRLLGYGYDLPEKSPKKEKKWSIGSLFRRNKKKDESESSSEEDLQKKGFLNRKRRKSADNKRKNKPKLGTFDHVVIPRSNCNGYVNVHEDSGILSDPTGGFENYVNRALPKIPTKPQTIITQECKREDSNLSRVSSDSKKTRLKGLAKIRAEVRRSNLKHESSSDEDSQRSASASSKFRSDDSLNGRDSSLSRRSRAARTERYLKRHSKDGENPKDLLKLSKSDAETSWKLSDDSNRSLSRSPLVPIKLPGIAKTSYSSLSSISGLSTIPPPSHGISNNRIRVSNSTSNPSYKPPLSMNEYNHSTKNKLPDYNSNNQRSISCDSNIHHQPEVIHVQFPIRSVNNNHRQRNLTVVDPTHMILMRQPPPPPPRDPKRLVTAQYYENGRPSSYYFDSSGQMRSKSFTNANSNPKLLQHQSRKSGSFNLHPNYRSTSEDQLVNHSLTNLHVSPRPSSATPDSTLNNRNRNRDGYNYLTDKKPRSRKPIFIQTSAVNDLGQKEDKSGAQKALDFWRRKDKEVEQFQQKPQMFTCQTHVQTQVFLPSVLPSDLNSDNLGSTNEDDVKRKSSNLEEALDELEAIYKSLRLGDEDLLERAEQREKDAALKKFKESQGDVYPNLMGSRGTLSDSSFSYEPFDQVDSPRRKRLSRRSQTIDRRGDDMAYRKLNKVRSSTINDPQSFVSKLSYLQASPLYNKDNVFSDSEHNKNSKEPDVTLDDVVYRNVKYSNNNPKVIEPQPPFGIPLGPIAPGANSDYLHAVSEEIVRPTYKSRKIPDVVKDDLAFRNLRKDTGKEPALPPLSAEDLKNNNALDLMSLKKRRAVRSLSANVGSLITNDKFNRNNDCGDVENEFKTLTDIADAMEIARQVLREKETRISNTRRAFLSDSDSKNANSLTESRLNFLNSLKTPCVQSTDNYYLQRKPPRSPKESTPVPVSPLDDRLSDSKDESFDDLLTALAVEARETSERITKELHEFREEKEKKNSLKKDRQLSEIEQVSNQAKLCEKLLQGVVDSTKSPDEEVVGQIIKDSPEVLESKANIVLTPEESTSTGISESVVESDHDYENLLSDKDLNEGEVFPQEIKCTSPFEEHKAELIASFQELKKNIDLEIEAVKCKSEPREIVDDEIGEVSGEDDECAAYCLSPNKNHNTRDDFETSSGFHSIGGSTLSNSLCELDGGDLKSPKLVMESARLPHGDENARNRTILENQSMIVPERSRNAIGGNARDDFGTCSKSGPNWYRDPATVAVACSYGLACAHQLASLDLVAVLGILFAVLSFIAALLF